MLHKRKLAGLMLPLFLLLASLLSACQNGQADHAQACNQKSAPVIKMLEPVQASSQTIYASNGSDLYAFNAGNGAPRWCSAIFVGNSRDEFASLTDNGGSVYAYTDAGNVTSFHAATGSFLWSQEIEDSSAGYSTPSVINTTVYGGSQSVYSLNTQDGSVRWNYAFPDKCYMPYPLVADKNSIYFSVKPDKLPEQIYALDAAKGNKRWFSSLATNTVVWSSLAASDGVIIFSYKKDTLDGETHFGFEALDAQNGKFLWQRPIEVLTPLRTEDLGAIVNGFLYMIGAFPDNKLNAINSIYALNIHTGAIKWSVPLGKGGFDDALIVAHDVLYRVEEGAIDARNAQNGQRLWQAQLQIGSSPVFESRLNVLNDHLFIGTVSLTVHSVWLLHAFNLQTRLEDWSADISGDAAEDKSIIVGV